MCKAAYAKVQELRSGLDAQWAAYKEQSAAFHERLMVRLGSLRGCWLAYRSRGSGRLGVRGILQLPGCDLSGCWHAELVGVLARHYAGAQAGAAGGASAQAG